ncbi:MAG: SGNH/GDSL hydrolase family protein [Aquaticitalea sp.]
MKKLVFLCFICFITFGACSNSDDDATLQNNNQMNDDDDDDTDTTTVDREVLKILSLGDSYTIGESVCDTCRFPVQLKDSLESNRDAEISIDIVAQTGWTTTTLISAINTVSFTPDFDLVTLLIGVNNQFQQKPFSVYETEFPLLLEKAIQFANGDNSKVIVVSIPDYAFTPFGQNSSDPNTISSDIDRYNAFAQNYSEERNITFVNITDITRLGLEQRELVASDGLHPSELAYAKFVERLLPVAIQKLN